MNILENVQMQEYTTFHTPAVARYFVSISTVEELQEFCMRPEYNPAHTLMIGGGSNILFAQDYEGTIIFNTIKGIEILQNNEKYIDIRVGAGENWHDFVLYAVSEGWGGIENLALIPGSVGATPVQNIGAYGSEIKDTIVSVETINAKTGESRTFSHNDCAFDYRSSIFKTKKEGEYYITHVVFRLTHSEHHILRTDYGDIQNILNQKNIIHPHMKDVQDAVITIRQSKLPDPQYMGNAGSFFKNPIITDDAYQALKTIHPNIPGYTLPSGEVKVPAGWLIDTAGWKGRRRGDVGVHEKQALVLVNYGGGTAQEIIDLAEDIMKDIYEKYNILLVPEVTIIH